MVAKIGSGSSLYGALSYNQQKVDKGEAKVLSHDLMHEPPDGNFSIEVCFKTFESYLLTNKHTKKPIIHISLNPDPKDNLTDEQLNEMAHECMEKLGYGNQPFLVYKHEDIDRHHLHIVSLRIDKNGVKLDHNYENRRSMKICRELEKKHGLIPADEKKKMQGFPLKKVQYGAGNIKRQISNVILPVAENWHFQSFLEYKALLSVCNVEVIEVKGESKGRFYRGILYAATNEKEEVCMAPIKSSKFGQSVGIKALEQRMAKSKILVNNKNLKERPKIVIATAIQKCRTQDDFEKELLKNGITVLFRKNDSGRIYGATFIDHKQKFVFNGSRLGKGFSANVFHEKFNNPKQTIGEIKFPEQEQPQNQYDSTSSIENLSGLIGLENRGENPEEEAFIRRMKRKKRHKRKL